ncbi:hypothetical protein KUTeg_016191 [Tegillarca granosa]|uniref:Vacuolar protein sorting-associated protein 72 homolog n=1 Tax=Tegillarca granosa TaxID=220873 RepID=A0ABQ9EK62_TEGGR|nr:hypothetical protein KUTeg_016191 [Tegillarca granosa]
MSELNRNMAAGREKRNNAGNKMAHLLEAEDEDDFYKTTYGGFTETDSDISIDENDEVKSDDDDEPKRKRRVVTKAYKEPAKKPQEKDKKPKEKKSPKAKTSTSTIQIYHSPSEKKSLRRTTSDKSKAREEREKQREAQAQMLKEMAKQKKVAEVRRLTQEELLREAKITEQQNLASLENYRRLELEKKKNRIQKQVHRGSIIRYHSLTMPLIEELPPEPEINVDGDRTFITFTDDRTFKDYFPQKKLKPTIKQYCPVTKLPAKYYDPITNTPYATIQAFRFIREAYARQLQEENSSEQKRKSKMPDNVQEVSVKS